MDETGEKPTLKVDQLIVRRGSSHTQALSRLAEKIQENFTPEKQEKLFSPEAKQNLDAWATSAPDKVNSTFREVYHALKGFESTNSPGHDFSHLVENLNAAQRIIQQYPNMSEAERLEIFTACLFHDLGRFAETFFEESSLDKKKLEVLLPAFVGRAFERKISKLPREFELRVLFDIGTGSQPKTEHLTADIVHQCDREQVLGTVVLLRALAFDVGMVKLDLTIPKREDLRHKLPMSESPDDRSWPIQCEFLMRNLYPPVSLDGESVANANKKEAALILMLALEGQGQELFNQVFGPELGLVKQGDEGAHWSKKPIPKEVFEEAKEEKRTFLESLENLGGEYKDDIGYLVDFTKQAIATDGVVLPKDFDATIKDKLEKCSQQERRNYWTIIVYTLVKRHQKRVSDIEILNKTQESSSGLLKVVSELVLEELKVREEIYQKTFPKLAKATLVT